VTDEEAENVLSRAF